jgi:hemerythrin-like domain-containing protein
MQPRGPLMIEHRLIMRMISLIGKEVISIEKNSVVNQSFIRSVVDFIRSYADRTHHGKEEDILFRDLAKKQLSSVDKNIMDELIQEHVFGRVTTNEVAALVDLYQKGDTSALPGIASTLRKFVDFYPKHIEKEEKVFFPLSMAYLSEPEQQSMLDEFCEFDAKLIHDKYKSVVEDLE